MLLPIKDFLQLPASDFSKARLEPFIQQSKGNYADIGKLSLPGKWKIPPHKSFIVVKISVYINKWEF